MNLAGIGISSGSACSSGKLIPSPALLAMGYSERAAKSGIRLTLGQKHHAEADIDWTAMVLKSDYRAAVTQASSLLNRLNHLICPP